MRLLLLFHRYLGIAIGLVMAMWCASGFVMMYVSFPALDSAQRLQHLQPIAWPAGCCATEKIATTLGVDVVDDFSIEMVGGRPILNVKMAVGDRHVFDLQSGEHINAFTAEQVRDIAMRYTSVERGPVKNTPAEVSVEHKSIHLDQWTVQGQFNRDRPLHHFTLFDAQGTQLYVSSTTGQLVQVTTRQQRFWNWLGAVPHWLYPIVLRQHGAVWSQVVIWLSLAGVFLTLIGLYIGIAHWRAMKGRGWSPYRGLSLWHHLSGLIFGVLALTWVGSGLVSMSPWGLFAGTGFKEERDRIRDVWIDGGQIAATVKLLTNSPTGATRIEAAPLNGQLYLLSYKGVAVERVDAKTLQPAPLQSIDVEHAVNILKDESSAETTLLIEGDNYYYSGHEPRSFPVYRVSVADKDRTRYYLDPRNADIIYKVGSDERWYRWLFEGLHRWDFSKVLRTRPWWDLLIVPLMLGVTLVCFTGVYMGYRRVMPRNNRIVSTGSTRTEARAGRF